jgi:uncharacterized protein (DUF736 family)
MSGSLRKNLKRTEEKHPSYKGLCKVRGVEFWVALWRNTGEDGEVYLSLKFSEKDADASSKSSLPGPVSRKTDDDIAF